MNKKVYLDYASTTPVDTKVLEAMLPYFSEKYGNPSSIHGFGRTALVAIDQTREKIANFLQCEAQEIIFTGSATEANNIFIQGVIQGHDKPHIITSAIEHDAVLETVKKAAEVTVLEVDEKGYVDLEQLEKAIQENTVLISIMYANNEIGTIEPIAEIGKLIEKINKKREKQVLFHTDAAQAAGYLNCNINKLKVDGLTLSGHKIYGPKGVGVLYKSKKAKLLPIMFGGGQEKGLRSGTYNTPLIIGIGQAVEILESDNRKEETEKLRDYLINKVLQIEGAALNGPKKRLSNNANFSFKGVEGESLVLALDQQAIATSTGSACSSKTLEASHVLRAIGLEDLQAHSSLRVSVGRYTTKEDIDYFLNALQEIVQKLRKISGR